MSEITSLTTQPDPNQIAQTVSGAFDQAYAALNQAYAALQAGQPDDAQGALVVVDQALNIMAEQIGLQAALLVGQNAVIETQQGQIETLIDTMEEVKQDAYQDGYSDGQDEYEIDPYWVEEIVNEEVWEREHQIIDNAAYAADKLRSVGEADLAAEIEEKARRAIDLRDEAEKLIDRGATVAWNKRPPQTPLLLDAGADEAEESDE